MLTIAALYHFTRFPDPAALKPGLLEVCVAHGVKGSLLLARPAEADTKTAGGVLLPTSSQQAPTTGTPPLSGFSGCELAGTLKAKPFIISVLL